MLVKGLELYKIYEKTTIKTWIFNYLYVFLTNAEDIEEVITNPKFKRKSREYLVLQESIMGQGIFSIDNINQWKSNRKMVIAGFNYTIMRSFLPVFYEEACVLLKVLHMQCNQNSKGCDISVPISNATMEMIGRNALGIKFNAQNGVKHEFIENLFNTMTVWEYRITHPWYLNKTIFQFSTLKHKHDRSHKIINEFTDNIIKSKLAEIQKNKECINNDEIEQKNISTKSKTFIEILLQNFQNMSHKQIRDEIITIMIGGQETTAMANACIIFMLAHHQHVQNKVFEELEEIFSVGDLNRQPTYEDLQKMVYLERVIKETLRLYPPLPIIGRNLEEETKIGEYIIPANTSLYIFVIGLQTSSKYYENPEKFNPDNFLPEKCHNRHPYAYIPFSAGYRNCIGIKYAMLQMKTVISTMIRKFRFLPSDKCPTTNDLRLMFLTTLKFVDGCHVKIENRIKNEIEKIIK
ncbi:cytochrome P450 4C1-like isoform X2 [Daktulosphaira vitifoliae]|nr:cytochrome P450 4C1-like isoform X2 [Daktulosphaira vitifoliae]